MIGFRKVLRLTVLGILALAAQTQGVAAAVINVTYAGFIHFSADPAFPVGSIFSGTFTYSTDLLTDISSPSVHTSFWTQAL